MLRSAILLTAFMLGGTACSDDAQSGEPAGDSAADIASNDGGRIAADGADDASTVVAEPAPNLTPRQSHSATLLADGRLLVVGGWSGSAAARQSWIYDPLRNGWIQANDLPGSHLLHTATLLTDGRVLVAGGRATLAGAALASTAIFDPSDGSWLAGGDLVEARLAHGAALIATGVEAGKVLVFGGVAAEASATVEIFDPATSSSTLLSGVTLTTARSGPGVGLLAQGRILIAGGAGQDTADIFDPTTLAVAAAGNKMSAIRQRPSVVVLSDGSVLVANGNSETTSADLFDPSTDTFSPTLGPTLSARASNAFARSATGEALLIGGSDGAVLASVERYDPNTGLFSEATPLTIGLAALTATRLGDGRLLLVGGQDRAGFISGTSLFYIP